MASGEQPQPPLSSRSQRPRSSPQSNFDPTGSSEHGYKKKTSKHIYARTALATGKSVAQVSDLQVRFNSNKNDTARYGGKHLLYLLVRHQGRTSRRPYDHRTRRQATTCAARQSTTPDRAPPPAASRLDTARPSMRATGNDSSSAASCNRAAASRLTTHPRG